MKGYDGYQAKKNEGYLSVPPVGVYKAVIQKARFVAADGDKQQRDVIELFMDITEGEYKGRYMEIFNDQKERFGEVSYKGLYRLTIPKNEDEAWRKSKFEHDIWCVEECNAGFHWDWDKDESQLNGKKVCINLRTRLYTYNGKNYETTEIGRFESIKDFEAGKCKTLKVNDRRSDEAKNAAEAQASTDGSSFTEVTAEVAVPW